ncbi:hypothetical protein SAMN05421831_10328 [Allopseudospirillum japonicum]|uniref:Amine oxidase domain-containing protein n=1 Tax=Allopseudospirillum japonicum TaxID=64971 RepID=A0A1H6RDM5_9GAMM|nr:FAD-dependent oxidoreductase [Allopseudospirillum japonicum]SEI49900.1 hypothetical protein SAMN05421831_10328 [Allopseudospirillum japonicum]
MTSSSLSPPDTSKYPLAVIGAGIAGLTCARRLQDAGVPVVLFEKSRGPGGRLSSRRTALGTFDLGAQFFRAQHADFAHQVDTWYAQGILAPWPQQMWTYPANSPAHFASLGTEVETAEETWPSAWVAQPRMTALSRHLAQDLQIQTQVRIESLACRDHLWYLTDEQARQYGPFQQVVLATPAPQAVPLLQAHDSQLAQTVAQVQMQAVWAAYVYLPQGETQEIACAVNSGPLRWISCQSTKPERATEQAQAQASAWVLLSDPQWSAHHLQTSAQDVAAVLLEAARTCLPNTSLQAEPELLEAHRWLYAQAENPLNRGFLRSATGISLCGDWCLGTQVEDAWQSGYQLAGHLLRARGFDVCTGDV